MHIKNIFKARFIVSGVAASLLLPQIARPQGAGPAGYETSFATITRITGDLHHAVDRKYRPGLSPAPLLVPNFPTPCLQSFPVKGPNLVQAVSLSSGWVEVLNYISHAKAIDGVSHGFFNKAMTRLALEGADGVPDLQANSVPNAWGFEAMNNQASAFNQMAGTLIAIEMAHNYLGHYRKYASQLAAGQHESLPVNSVVTPAEWRQAVTLAARHGLDCGFAVDGLKLVFESIDKMPARPPWRNCFLPDAVTGKDLTKINRELDLIQRHALLSDVH